jgi:hypothetical protein
MKGFVILLFFYSFFITGCIIPYAFVDSFFEEKVEGHYLYENPLFQEEYSSSSISSLISNQVTWTSDPENLWQNPEYTWFNQTGDCEDMAILYLNISYFSTGNKGKLALVAEAKGIVTGGFSAEHAIVWDDGIYLDPISGTTYEKSDIMYEYSFDTVFSGSL